MTARTGYSAAQIALHWITALLVVAAWFTPGSLRPYMRPDSDATGIPLHVLLGLGVLLAVLARLALRARQGAPEPAAGSGPLRAAAIWGHRLLYLLLLAVPLMGMATFGGGIRALGPIHGLAANLLLALALGHALLAIWHQFALRDGTLSRMSRPGR